MKEDDRAGSKLSRRKFLTLTGSAVAGAAALGSGAAPTAAAALLNEAQDRVIFWGTHQAGIATPAQKHTYFAAFDLTAGSRQELISLLKTWTGVAVRLTAGQPAEPLEADLAKPGSDSGETIGLSPERLTITFGFGPGMFVSNGADRYGLLARRPEALVDLPTFSGDQLTPEQTGGDISIQACSDDPQVAFHAVRQLSRLSYGAAQIRWAQTGFLPNYKPGQTPRNLMGFKDGTQNVSIDSVPHLDDYVWVGSEGPQWMHGGSYLVVRRIRIALEHWDRMPVDFQEQTFGRHKYSGAPLGGKTEFEKMNLDAVDSDGNPVIASNAHARLASAVANGGAQILRRPYSYNDGMAFTSERWPPWHQGMEFDAGLLFFAYQKDPRSGFIKMFDIMSKIDMLNQFATHVGGGIFVCPPGIQPGGFIGDGLFV